MNIIEKEKARQEELLKLIKETYDVAVVTSIMMQHKQSLINLKEYMEEELGVWIRTDNVAYFPWVRFNIETIKEDIKELTKLIEAYK